MSADKANPTAVSRRALLGAASTTSVLGLVPATRPDPLVARCAEWLAIDLESDRLSLRWAALETRLVDECGWFSLSNVERRGLPQAAEMFEIEERLDRLSDEREQRLAALASLRAQDLQGVAGKLAVGARVLLHTGGPVHQLVADAVRVLASHHCSHCGAAGGTERSRERGGSSSM